MARRATSLGPKPSHFFIFWGCFFFWGGGGSLFFVILSLLLIQKSCFPPTKGIFLFIFECLPLFLLSLFWPPTFSISLYLSLSLSLSLFFLLSFSFVLFSFLLFVSFIPFLSSLFFMKRTTSKHSLHDFLHHSFLFFLGGGFLSCFSFQMPLSCLCFFPDLELCFLFTIIVFLACKTNKFKTPIFLCEEEGLQQNVFVYQPVF